MSQGCGAHNAPLAPGGAGALCAWQTKEALA